jgi:hypothetical protein
MRKNKRFSMARFSTIKIVIYFLQHLVFMKQWLCNLISHKVLLRNQLPKGYLMKQNLPNRKQLDLSKTKAQLFNQVPDAAP